MNDVTLYETSLFSSSRPQDLAAFFRVLLVYTIVRRVYTQGQNIQIVRILSTTDARKLEK